MAIPKEAIERVTTFCPVKGTTKGKQVIDLGGVDGRRLVYGTFGYQQRVMSLPEEPFVLSWTRQPVLALEDTQNGRTSRITLAYPADVRALGNDLVAKVTNLLNIVGAR